MNTIVTILGILANIVGIFESIRNTLQSSKKNYPQSSTMINNSNILYSPTTSNKTVNYHYHNNTSTNEDLNTEKGIGIIFLLIIFISIYAQIYNLLPAICAILLLFNIKKDEKRVFGNNTAKLQQVINNLIYISTIVFLLFIPSNVKNLIVLIPNIKYNSLSELLGWLFHCFYIIKDSYLNIFNHHDPTFIMLLIRVILLCSIIYIQIIYFKKNRINARLRLSFIKTFLLIIFAFLANSVSLWNFIFSIFSNINYWLNS